jgi:hypothetical protein
MPFTPFTPNAGDLIIDPKTGQFTEIGRILVRTLTQAVSGFAPTTAQYVTTTSDAGLSNERNLGALASGYLRIVSAAGIAVPSSVASIPLADIATLVAGAYTPTLFNVANLRASTAFSCQYLRVGGVITVSGRVDVDPITTATDTQLGISLPIASALANAGECAGSAWAPTLTSEGGAILADVANGRATLQWKAVDVTNTARYFSFTYRVI